MQQLREHYERQDTEELLELAGKGLTDEARLVLQEVLSRRGISADRVDAARISAVEAEAAQSEADKRLASLGVRLVAFIIDVWGVGIALYLVLLPLQFVSANLHAFVYSAAWFTYFLFRDAIPGQGIGKRLLGIRVKQHDSDRPCNWSKSFWRNATHVIFVIDALFALGRRRMRLGDMIAGTVVVRSKLDTEKV
ncbi:RDD family protein [Roseateles chitinivorans]|uniref:RDD family protein n=1 Tax=Roseateles chitinivorans TaxID=2917965 RepID=UPI003D678929